MKNAAAIFKLPGSMERNTHMDYDVIIIGAGPGGIFSAYELSHLNPELKVLVFDRPWNRECVFPGENYTRCTGWDMIRNIII